MLNFKLQLQLCLFANQIVPKEINEAARRGNCGTVIQYLSWIQKVKETQQDNNDEMCGKLIQGVSVNREILKSHEQ
jgi:hypothetical protein